MVLLLKSDYNNANNFADTKSLKSVSINNTLIVFIYNFSRFNFYHFISNCGFFGNEEKTLRVFFYRFSLFLHRDVIYKLVFK